MQGLLDAISSDDSKHSVIKIILIVHDNILVRWHKYQNMSTIHSTDILIEKLE